MRAALLALLGAAAAGAQTAEEPLFRSDVNLVNVLATVLDEKGRPIGGLEREDFAIVDEGQPREIAVFERRTDRPLSVVLLVDTSLSTRIELKFEKASAKRFAARLLGPESRPQDRLAVMRFSEGVELLAEFTRDLRRLERAIDRLKPSYGTSLYDAMLLASEELAERPGRHVVVVISDGADTTSYTSFRRAREAVQNADAVVFALIVRPVKSDAGRNVGGENALRTFAETTGGLTFVEYGEEGLDRAFGEILENLRTQYLLSYYPPEHSDPNERFRRIEVRVGRPHGRVLARTGYYVPEVRKLLPESVPPDRLDVQPRPRGWREAPRPAPETTPKAKP